GGEQGSIERYLSDSGPVDVSFVLGFKSQYLGAEIPSQFVAACVRQHPDRLIGFAGLDPTDLAQAIEQLHEAHEELGIRGITVAPAVQNIHPADTRAMQLYAEAERLKLPVIFDQVAPRLVAGRMEYGRPALLDEVARELPGLQMLIAQMGYPWVEETAVLLGEHANVFADVSGLVHRPWQAYNALLSACEYGVMDKLLFGSGFPYGSAKSAIEALYSINQISHGTNLPTIPRQQLQAIVERDAVGLLGIDWPRARPGRVEAHALLDDEPA
ncbi:MAG: amidohydrolase family protein, partial [Phycisphaerae bacterium]